MFSSLIVTTVHAPLLFGVAFAVIAALWPRRGLDLALAAALLLAAYVLLEGRPALPPVASKQKLAYLLPLAAVLVALAPRLRLPLPALTAGFLLSTAVWLGWAKIGQGGALALAPILPVILGATIGAARLPRTAGQTFPGPLALLMFAIGGAILSLLGVFVGFAQVSGAFAAFAGGILLVLYVASLTGRAPLLTTPVLSFLLIGFASTVLLIGLFAPKINIAALAILPVTLVMPALVPGFAALPRPLRPVLQGVVTAIPAACAIALAYLQS